MIVRRPRGFTWRCAQCGVDLVEITYDEEHQSEAAWVATIQMFGSPKIGCRCGWSERLTVADGKLGVA